MTLAEIDYLISLRKAGGHETMPVPLSEWREWAMASRIGKATVTTDPKTGKRKVKPREAPPIFKRAKEEKAARMIKRLTKNREKAK